MELEADAGVRLDKVPTSRDVTQARRVLADGHLSKIEELVEKGVAVEGLKKRYHEVKVCGGAAGCPLSLTDDRSVSLALAGVLDASGLGGRMAGMIEGPVLFHHRFRVAVAGCPNACSQPQIVDFGLIAQSAPGRGEGNCTGCGQCIEACKEGGVTLSEEGPVFDTARCLNCGQCFRSCPAGAIREAGKGFRVMAGGRLGRRPRLAEVLLEMAGETESKVALEGAVKLYIEEGRDGERFSGVVERIGTDRLRP